MRRRAPNATTGPHKPGRLSGRRAEQPASVGPTAKTEGRPGYRSFAVTYAATIGATMRTNTLAPNHPWLRNPGPPCACLRPHDMIASCGEPALPAAFVSVRIPLSLNRRDPAMRFAAPGGDGDRGAPICGHHHRRGTAGPWPSDIRSTGDFLDEIDVRLLDPIIVTPRYS